MADLESRARARGKLLRNQQNPEEDPAKKAANEISTIIRTQRKECRTLQQHPIFKELQSAVGLKKISKSLVESEGDNGGVVKPAFDDVQSEGVARMFEKIRQTAIDNSKPLQGIWASFGKPYVCMGAPEEPKTGLPSLYRDELRAKDAVGRLPPKHNKGRKAPAARPPPSFSSSAPESASAAPNADGSSPPEPAGYVLPDPALQNIEEIMLRAQDKTVIKMNPLDRQELRFPASVLKASEERLHRVKASTTTYVHKAEADAEASKPSVAYGGWEAQTLSSSRRTSRAQHTGPGAAQEFNSGPLTSQPAHGGAGGHHVTSVGPHPPGSASAGGPGSRQQPLEAQQDSSPGGSPPFQPLVEPVLPAWGDERNPVYRWHNEFVDKRHEGRQALQQALWERAEGRHKARSLSPMAAEMATALFSDLDLTRGASQGHYVAGNMPMSPFLKMEMHSSSTARAAARNSSASALDADEVKVLQRFYDQLCALVEQQKMSDPVSLMVVHKVKSLLEAGTFLHKALLTQVVSHVASFTKGCGLVRYNPFLLPILIFVTRCVGCNDEDLQALLAQHDLFLEVFGDEGPPPPPLPKLPPLHESTPDVPGGLSSRRQAGMRMSLNRPGGNEVSATTRSASRMSSPKRSALKTVSKLLASSAAAAVAHADGAQGASDGGSAAPTPNAEASLARVVFAHEQHQGGPNAAEGVGEGSV